MFLPDNIDFEKPHKYILSIRITPTFFSYFIYEKRAGGEYCYRQTSLEKESNRLSAIQQIIFEYNFLTLAFYKTNVIVVSNDYELIPNYLLEKSKIINLYNFTHTEKSHKVLSSTQCFQENTTIFKIEEDVYKFLMRSLFNPQFHHHTSFILDYIASYNQTTKDVSLLLNIHSQFIDIFVFDKNLVLKYNVTLENESDVNSLYYIMNIWDKSGLDQLNDRIYILDSNRNLNNTLVKQIKNYIKNVDILKIKTVHLPNINEEDDLKIPIDLLICK